MKRILLVLSFMAMIAFLAAPAWAGPSSLSDDEMDSVHAKGIQVSGTGTGGTGTGASGSGTGTGSGSNLGLGTGLGLGVGGSGTGVGGNENDGIDNKGIGNQVGLASAEDKSQAVGIANEVAQARNNSVAVGKMDNGTFANDYSNASHDPLLSAVAQGDSTAYNASNNFSSAVALSRSSAVHQPFNSGVQVRVSGDNAFNSQQNQTYVNQASIFNNGGQTVANSNTASAQGGLASVSATAFAPATATVTPTASVTALNLDASSRNALALAGQLGLNFNLVAALGLGNDSRPSASNGSQNTNNSNTASGGDGSSKADASNSYAGAQAKVQLAPYAKADASADTSAYAYATGNNQHQNNLNKSIQVKGGQTDNAGNVLMGIQSVVAQQVNATSASSSMLYGGQTLQGNAIAVNAFHN